MYAHICFVTSVRGMIFLPQIAANAGLRVFGAKMPSPFFFISRAFFFPAADMFFLPWRFFSAVIFLRVAFVMVVFFVATVVTVVFVVVVISQRADESARTSRALS